MINNKTNYKIAMNLLGNSNIFKTLFLFIKWILVPKSALTLAKDIESKIKPGKNNLPEIIAIGYINEFFSKYIEYGKSKHQILETNRKIDLQKRVGDKIKDTLVELRKIRLKIKKFNPSRGDQLLETTRSFGVSQGIVTGKCLNVTSVIQAIPNNCIGIFHSSGTKYTTQLLKCVGIIFLNGSVTSHGAILAREQNIPAIVNPNAKLKNGEMIQIDGTSGKLKRIVDMSRYYIHNDI